MLTLQANSEVYVDYNDSLSCSVKEGSASVVVSSWGAEAFVCEASFCQSGLGLILRSFYYCFVPPESRC